MFYSSHQFYINSKHKITGTRNNDIILKGPDNIRDITHFKIVSVYIPHTYYSINSTNNTLIIRKSGDSEDRIITIPIGDYTFNDLSTTLKTVMDGSGGPVQTYTITEQNNNNKIVITQNSNTFILRANGTINEILGFSTVTDTADQITHIGIHSYDLSYTKHIKIYCPQLTKFFTLVKSTGRDSSDLLLYIPVNSIYGGIIEYRPETDIYYDCQDWNNNIDLEFYLRDDNDNLLGGATGLNNRNWHMHIQFMTYRKNHPDKLRKVEYRYGDGAGDVYN